MNGEDQKTFQEMLDAYIAETKRRLDPEPVEDEEKKKEEDVSSLSKAEEYRNSYLTSTMQGAFHAQSQLPEYLPHGLDVGKSKLDYKGKGPHPHLTDEQVVNIGEVRGQRQSNFDKWANGIMKGVAKTGIHVVGGTLGAVNGLLTGLYKGIANGEWSTVWDNGFADSLDDINDKLDNALPNYYTQA